MGGRRCCCDDPCPCRADQRGTAIQRTQKIWAYQSIGILPGIGEKPVFSITLDPPLDPPAGTYGVNDLATVNNVFKIAGSRVFVDAAPIVCTGISGAIGATAFNATQGRAGFWRYTGGFAYFSQVPLSGGNPNYPFQFPGRPSPVGTLPRFICDGITLVDANTGLYSAQNVRRVKSSRTGPAQGSSPALPGWSEPEISNKDCRRSVRFEYNEALPPLPGETLIETVLGEKPWVELMGI